MAEPTLIEEVQKVTAWAAAIRTIVGGLIGFLISIFLVPYWISQHYVPRDEWATARQIEGVRRDEFSELKARFDSHIQQPWHSAGQSSITDFQIQMATFQVNQNWLVISMERLLTKNRVAVPPPPAKIIKVPVQPVPNTLNIP